MISIFISRAMMLTAGTLYPAYRSYKAVRTKDVKEYVKWMMYWIVFALITCAESIADLLLAFWFPFYYELKILFVLWLISPWTKGASLMYRNWIHPWLLKNERQIDFYLEQAKSEGYNQVLSIGTKGLMAARDIVATAALRGQEQISQQLQRSYSLNDVSNRLPAAPTKKQRRHREFEHQEDWIEEEVPEERHLGDHSHSWAGNIVDDTTSEHSPHSSRASTEEPVDYENPNNTLPRRSSRTRRTVQ